LYSFKSSQVTIGGLSLEEINNNLESKKEKNVYFIGEVLDNDGLCGGLNLMWCFATAFKLSVE
jgi:predicted flavoprotein YhiN